MLTSTIGVGRQLQADDKDIRDLFSGVSEVILTDSTLKCVRTDAKMISAEAC